MKTKHLVLISVTLISLILSMTLIISSKSDIKASPSHSSKCNVIAENGENTINIAFLSDKNTAEDYVDYFLSISPYEENGEKFSFYYVDEDVKCEIYRENALFCKNRNVIKAAAVCPDVDYVVVIQQEPVSVRSSASSNIMSLNLNHPLTTLAHEFAHVFANKAEEYLTATRIPRGSDNCVLSCEDFGGEEDGCYKECTDSEYYRSVDEGFMRSLNAESYGKFNERTIAEKIFEFSEKKNSNLLAGFATNENPESCENQRFIIVEGNYQNGQIEITSKEKARGCFVNGNEFGLLDYKVIREDGEVIFSGSFLSENIFVTDYNPETGEITAPPIENEQFIISLPEFQEKAKLQIFEDNSLLMEIELNDIGERLCKL
ncbi:hypothetical protein HY450_00775 [Candidatus Pacearchaeota archaeon]|nr:hypothetical protein [Candidatus Pacearchaeota archaeon]